MERRMVSRGIHEDKCASRSRVDIFVETVDARNAGPPRSKSSTCLDEFTGQNKNELRALVSMCRKPRSRFASHYLHFEPICRCDVLDEYTRSEG